MNGSSFPCGGWIVAGRCSDCGALAPDGSSTRCRAVYHFPRADDCKAAPRPCGGRILGSLLCQNCGRPGERVGMKCSRLVASEADSVSDARAAHARRVKLGPDGVLEAGQADARPAFELLEDALEADLAGYPPAPSGWRVEAMVRREARRLAQARELELETALGLEPGGGRGFVEELQETAVLGRPLRDEDLRRLDILSRNGLEVELAMNGEAWYLVRLGKSPDAAPGSWSGLELEAGEPETVGQAARELAYFVRRLERDLLAAVGADLELLRAAILGLSGLVLGIGRAVLRPGGGVCELEERIEAVEGLAESASRTSSALRPPRARPEASWPVEPREEGGPAASSQETGRHDSFGTYDDTNGPKV